MTETEVREAVLVGLGIGFRSHHDEQKQKIKQKQKEFLEQKIQEQKEHKEQRKLNETKEDKEGESVEEEAATALMKEETEKCDHVLHELHKRQPHVKTESELEEDLEEEEKTLDADGNTYNRHTVVSPLTNNLTHFLSFHKTKPFLLYR